LSESNGNLDARVMFIAEAPGRLGADRTGIPLCGDRTGDNFESLLAHVDWNRDDVFATNSVLCNPQRGTGLNATPTETEVASCSPYLMMTIELVRPEVVATLGAVALAALDRIAPHGLNLRSDAAKPIEWHGRTLFPLYHPGPRALVHRPLAEQRADFAKLAKLVRSGKGDGAQPTRTTKEFEPSRFQQVAYAMLLAMGKTSYFKLTKLLYLVDLNALTKLGHTLTGEIYLRQREGPWPPAMQKQLPALGGREMLFSFAQRLPFAAPGPSPRFEPRLDERALNIIAETLAVYGQLGNSALKTSAYLTSPMRHILKQEKAGRDVSRVPVLYKDKTAVELDRCTTNSRDARRT